MSIVVPEPIIVNNGGGTSSSGGSVITTDPGTNTTVVNNETVNITTNQFQTTDNIFDINEGETGAGVSAGLAGINIDRGTLPDYKLVFNEVTGIMEFGPNTGRDAIVSLPNFITFPDGSIPAWNATDFKLSSTNYINATAVTNVKNLDQKVNKSSNVEFNDLKIGGTFTAGGQTLTFPSNSGLSNYVLTSDGAGVLSWTSKTSGVAATSTIIDSTTTTLVTTEQTAADKTIRLIADSKEIVTATKDRININTSLNLNKIETTNTNYTIANADVFINYNGASTGFINLPDVTAWSGRILIIHNRSAFDVTVRSLFSQNIFESTASIILSTGETVKLFSDGIVGWI